MNMCNTTSRMFRSLACLPLTGALALVLAACGGAQTPPAAAAPPPAQATATTPLEPTAMPAATTAPQATTEPTTVPAASSDGAASLTKAVLTTGLNDQNHPVDETNAFKQSAEIYLQLTFAGRPKQGVVRAELLYQGEKATESTVDLGGVNGGVIISIGQDTFVNFNFTQNKPFPIGDQYRIDAYLDGQKIGSYPFKIVAADGSSQGNTTPETAPTDSASSAPAATDAPTTDAGPAHEIDEPITLGNLIVTVNGVDVLKGDTISAPDAGNMFIAVDVSIKNTGSEKQVISSLLQMAVRDGAGKKYDLDLVASTLAGADPDGDLQPGATKRGKVGFQVPEKVSGLQFLFDDPIEGSATVNLQKSAARNSDQTPAATTKKTLGALKPYTHPSGIFTISLPKEWQNTNEEKPGIVQFAAYPSDHAGGVLLIVTQSKKTLDAKQQLAHLRDTVRGAYGDQPDFALTDAETESDGSQLVGVDYTDNGTKMHGDSYVWQRGDKLVILYAFADADQYDALWSGGLRDVVNSVEIDDTAAFTL